MHEDTNNDCKQFVKDMLAVGLEVEHYRGRNFWQGPAVRVDSIQDAMSSAAGRRNEATGRKPRRGANAKVGLLARSAPARDEACREAPMLASPSARTSSSTYDARLRPS